MRMIQMVHRVIDMDHINPTAAQVAAALKEAIRASGLSQREVGERACIPLTTLNRHLRDGQLTWDEIRAVCRVIGRSAAGVITDAAVAAASSAAA